MSDTAAPEPPRSGAALVLASLLEARTGQRLATGRSWRIDTALRPLLTELGLETLEELVGRLLEGRDATIGDRIVDAMLNQETSFFRDAGVIEQAAAAVASPAGDARDPRRRRVWCAACSTGQEALSLAMTFADDDVAVPDIVATDVSHHAIRRARTGSYTHFEIQRGLPIRKTMRWFASQPDGGWQAHEELLRLVSYRRHNLVSDAPPVGLFDMVLCRNVLFYLSPDARDHALRRIAAALRPGGLLLLGAGETVIDRTELFRPSVARRGFYERVAADTAGLRMFSFR